MVNTSKKPSNQGRSKTGKMRTIIFVFLIILAVAAVGTGSFFITKLIAESNNNSPDNPSSSLQKSDNPETDYQSDESNNNSYNTPSTPNNPQTPVQYEGGDPNQLENLSGVITFAGASEGKLLINASIDQFVNGTCNIVLTSSSAQVINVSASLSEGPTSAFCSYKGDLLPSGTWKIEINIEGNNKTGTITGEMQL